MEGNLQSVCLLCGNPVILAGEVEVVDLERKIKFALEEILECSPTVLEGIGRGSVGEKLKVCGKCGEEVDKAQEIQKEIKEKVGKFRGIQRGLVEVVKARGDFGGDLEEFVKQHNYELGSSQFTIRLDNLQMKDVVAPGIPKQSLVNSLVVQEMSKYSLDLEILKLVRSICKSWNITTLQKWRKSSMLKLQDQSTDSPNGMSISNFLNFFQNDQNLLKSEPFSGFTLCNVNLKSDCKFLVKIFNPIPPNIVNFWEMVGGQVTHLHFSNCLFQGDCPENFTQILVAKLVNLKSLKISDCQVIPVKPTVNDNSASINLRPQTVNSKLNQIQVVGQCPIQFNCLLLITPNLQELSISTNLDHKNLDYHFRSLSTIPRTNNSLKYLDIMDVLMFEDSPDNWERRLKFPSLEHLAVTVFRRQDYFHHYDWYKTEDVERILVPLIESHTESLKILKIFRPPVVKCFWNSSLLFPHEMEMTVLEELWIWGNLILNFEFLANMPKLRVLHVSHRCHDKLDKLEKLLSAEDERSREESLNLFASRYNPLQKEYILGTRREVKVEGLERCYYDIEVDSKCVEILGRWMPNLRVLEVVCGKEAFYGICRWLSDLEELVLLQGSEIGDEELTGLKGGNERRRDPNNLLALTRLRRFELKQVGCSTEKNRLGDKAVYQGFLKLSTLKRVHICASQNMTTEAETALKQHVADALVIRPHFVDEQRECCRLKSFYLGTLKSTCVL